MKIRTNRAFENLPKNYLFSETAKRISDYEKTNPERKVCRLGIGDVVLPLGKTAIKAMQTAISEMGKTVHGYAPESGYDFLKESISRWYLRRKVEIPSEWIFVSDGAKNDLGALSDLFGKNPIYVPDPGYPVYADANLLGNHRVYRMAAVKENGFLPMPQAVHHKRAIIYLCSPHNPTGTAYTKKQLQSWVNFARETDSLLIFDNAYEAFQPEDSPHTIFEADGATECAVEINSLSKSAGFTGVRVGWSVFPQNALRLLWARRQACKHNGVSYISQRAAQAALSEEGIAEIREHTAYYLENAALLREALRDNDVPFAGGVCSPYLWLQVPEGYTSWDFFDQMLRKAQIAATPGAGFGKYGEGYLRLSAFASRETVTEVCHRLWKCF